MNACFFKRFSFFSAAVPSRGNDCACVAHATSRGRRLSGDEGKNGFSHIVPWRSCSSSSAVPPNLPIITIRPSHHPA